ncbi:MAG: cation:proton antiporter [Candidatus Sericytochromatia bacterium]|nr:cation:proton antiporter [Candidatus Sericytochromatia bacterium]
MHRETLMALELLAAVTIVAAVARRAGLPYATALVVTGLGLGYSGLLPPVKLDAEWMLGLFLPILLFEAAINTNASHLRDDRVPVGLLASAGVFVSAAFTAAGVAWALALPWQLALLMGVMFSITDTVAVLAVFRSLKVPARLATIMEGESLFNDGVTLVLFKLVLAVVLTGAFHPGGTLLELGVVSFGGMTVGMLAGLAATWALRAAPDHLSEIALTVLLALSTYHGAEWLHVSGVIAVVVAGLVVGNHAWKRALAPSSQIAMGSFWEFAAFGVNSLVFLLVGLNIPLQSLWQRAPEIAWCTLAIVVGRAVAVYGGFSTLRLLRTRPVPASWQHAMVWGNMKGSLTMVLALSLPSSVPQRDLVVTVTVGVVLVSLLLQGLSLGAFIRWLRISGVSALQRRFEECQLQLIRARAAQTEVGALVEAGILSRSAYERLKARYQVIVAQSERELRRLGTENQLYMDEALAHIQQRVLQVEKAAVLSAMRQGLVSEQIGLESLQAINARLVAAEQAHARADTDGGLLPDVGPFSEEAARRDAELAAQRGQAGK